MDGLPPKGRRDLVEGHPGSGEFRDSLDPANGASFATPLPSTLSPVAAPTAWPCDGAICCASSDLSADGLRCVLR